MMLHAFITLSLLFLRLSTTNSKPDAAALVVDTRPYGTNAEHILFEAASVIKERMKWSVDMLVTSASDCPQSCLEDVYKDMGFDVSRMPSVHPLTEQDTRLSGTELHLDTYRIAIVLGDSRDVLPKYSVHGADYVIYIWNASPHHHVQKRDQTPESVNNFATYDLMLVESRISLSRYLLLTTPSYKAIREASSSGRTTSVNGPSVSVVPPPIKHLSKAETQLYLNDRVIMLVTCFPMCIPSVEMMYQSTEWMMYH
jgi:hypothetical protein